jgi:hypothetical protein
MILFLNKILYVINIIIKILIEKNIFLKYSERTFKKNI